MAAATAVLRPVHTLNPAALRRARQDRGLTLRDVAGHVDLHFTALGRFERGEVIPRADIVGVLAGLYGVEPGSFYVCTTT